MHSSPGLPYASDHEQIRTIDKQRLRDLVCHLDEEIMNKVDEAIRISFELHT